MSRSDQDSREQRFAAPWGTALRLITIITCVVLVIVAVIVALAAKHSLLQYAAAGVPPLIVVGSWLFSVRGYVLRGACLWIIRPLWETCVPLAGLESVESDGKPLKSSLRVFGNGGLFSFSGWFWNSKRGLYRAWVTDLNSTLVLHFTHRRDIVISPAHPEAFKEGLKPWLTGRSHS